MIISRLLIFGLGIALASAACSSFKTRKDVAEEAKVQAVESGEEAGPIDDAAIDDGLAEMGVDPHEKPVNTETPEPEVSGEVSNSDPAESPPARTSEANPPVSTPPPMVAPPPTVQKPVAKKKTVAKKPVAKSKKKPVKKSAAKKTTKKKPAPKTGA